ncbi:MAG: hypothetical protein AAF456_21705 [Planctomycetota bacterium]
MTSQLPSGVAFRFLLAFTFAASLFVFHQIAPASAQEQQEQEAVESAESSSEAPARQRDDDGQAESVRQAVRVFDELKTLVSENNWETARTKMTPAACDQFCTTLVISSIGLAETDLPMEIPGLSDSIDAIDEAVNEFGLDRLPVDVGSAFEMEFSSDPGELMDDEDLELELDEEQESEQGETEDGSGILDTENSRVILEHLDEDGKRWEIIGGLWDVMSQSPLAMSEFNGNVLGQEADGDTVYLRLELKSAGGGEQDGMQIEIMSPPVVVKITKQEDGAWLYDGMDPERTEEAFEEFAESMPGMDGGGGRSDF